MNTIFYLEDFLNTTHLKYTLVFRNHDKQPEKILLNTTV